MKRLLPSATALLIGLTSLLVSPSFATAAVLPAAYSGSAGGDVVALNLDVTDGVTIAGARLAVSSSEVDSEATPRASSAAGNLAAAVAGLGLAVESDQQTAPPDNSGPVAGTIVAASVTDLLDLGALSTSVEAHYTTDAACVPGNLLTDSQVETAGITVAPTGVGEVVGTGTSSTRGIVDLVPAPAGDPYHRAVRSRALGTIADAAFLGGAVQVGIAGDSALTAVATGEAGGASVDYDPGTVTVTVSDVTVTLEVGASQEFLVGSRSVTLTVNEPTIVESANGRTATGSVAVVTAQVRVGPVGNPSATATVDLLPLRAEAVAPSGGIDCPPAAPVLVRPADGSSTADRTPTFRGSAVPGASVEVFVDGVSVGTTVADGEGRFSVTPTEPLALGEYDAAAVATVDGVESAPSEVNRFAVAAGPAAPVLVRPADGSSTADTTPTFSGSAVPGASVEIFVDGVSVGTTVADGEGRFSVTPTEPLALGEYDAAAVATVDGVESAQSDINTFVVDTEAPSAPVITSPLDGSIANDTTPVISGTGEPGATVTVFIDGEAIGSDIVDEDGTFSVLVTEPLVAGHSYYVSAVQTDPAGNTSPAEGVAFRVGGTSDSTTDPNVSTPNPNNPNPNNPNPDNPNAANADDTVGGLASTGGPMAWPLVLGMLGLASGAVLVLTGRTRRIQH